MRKVRKNTATRQVIHIVGEGLTELFQPFEKVAWL